MAILRALRSPSVLIPLLFCALAVPACAGVGDVEGRGDGGAGGEGGSGGGSSGSAKPGEHGCFATETTCDGKCVHLESNPAHCGACNTPCASGMDQAGQCVNGQCVFSCDPGFVEDQGSCKNFFGAYEPNPNDCLGCGAANPYTGGCACPSPSSEISLSVQSDCPAMALRSATRLNLCVTPGVSPDTDFGGAYQVDDLDGWCGATAKCRVGNPLAGGACACPAGFDDATATRSIVRLPCDGGEVGTTVVFCGNKEAPLRSFGGAFQVDDFEPTCRVGNPYTGGCSCPAGTTDRDFRVMVDGGAGLYGSRIHLCTL
ncbi:MAG TPA: hypothetical protein VE093_45710 [Polyangiaceae bacterium]|nr:hypothetical protein [Polyangiaceae bacterium]